MRNLAYNLEMSPYRAVYNIFGVILNSLGVNRQSDRQTDRIAIAMAGVRQCMIKLRVRAAFLPISLLAY